MWRLLVLVVLGLAIPSLHAAPVPKGPLPANEEALKIILEKAASDNSKIRAEAVFELGVLGHPDGLPHARRFLDDKDPLVRVQAVHSVINLGEPDKKTLEVFAELAKNPEVQIGPNGFILVWWRLAEIGDKAKPFLPAIHELMKKTPLGEAPQGLLDSFAKGLPKYRPEMAPDLIQWITDADFKMGGQVYNAVRAMEGLAAIGKLDAKAITAIERYLTFDVDKASPFSSFTAARILLDDNPKHELALAHYPRAAQRASFLAGPGIPFRRHSIEDKITIITDTKAPRALRFEVIQEVRRNKSPLDAKQVARLEPLLKEDEWFQQEAILLLAQNEPKRLNELLPLLLKIQQEGKTDSESRDATLRLIRTQKLDTPAVRAMLRDSIQSNPTNRISIHSENPVTVLFCISANDPDPVAVEWLETRLKMALAQKDPNPNDPADNQINPREFDEVYAALAAIGPPAKRFLPNLVEILRQKNFQHYCGQLVSAIRQLSR